MTIPFAVMEITPGYLVALLINGHWEAIQPPRLPVVHNEDTLIIVPPLKKISETPSASYRVTEESKSRVLPAGNGHPFYAHFHLYLERGKITHDCWVGDNLDEVLGH